MADLGAIRDALAAELAGKHHAREVQAALEAHRRDVLEA